MQTMDSVLDKMAVRDYGCQVNAVDLDTLFSKYSETGFLYPEKRKELAPYFSEVARAWSALMENGQDLFWLLSHSGNNETTWSSICSWRATTNSWVTQHLTSCGDPYASCVVMLAAQALQIARGLDTSHQSWFRPANKYASRLFGTIVESVGSQYSVVNTYDYLKLPLSRASTFECAYTSSELKPSAENSRELVTDFISWIRGSVFVRAEELDQPDLNLEELDRAYSELGLRRYRRLRYVKGRDCDTPLGCAIAYRGPLGVNFSFLENRVDLIVHPDIDDATAARVACRLVRDAAPEYATFQPGALFIATDRRTSRLLQRAGANKIREYSQSIWLRDGFRSWYRHTERVFSRVLQRRARNGAKIPDYEGMTRL